MSDKLLQREQVLLEMLYEKNLINQTLAEKCKNLEAENKDLKVKLELQAKESK